MNDIYRTLSERSKNLKEEFYNQPLETIPFVIFSVEESTIRAFHASKGHEKKYKPLSIYRVWAYDFLTGNVDRLKSKRRFQALRENALGSLQNFWKKIDGGTPKFHHFNKLIDLMFKWLPLWTELDNETKEWVFNYANVPLDKFSLDLLRQCSNLSIPRNVSMSFVDENNYFLFQKEIKKICRDIPPIIFDLLAWKEGHTGIPGGEIGNPFELKKLDKKTYQAT